MPSIDVKRLAAEISVQHGIRVDANDPMMAVVTLNRLVLDASVAEIVETLQSATRDLRDAAEKVQLRAGAQLAKDVRQIAAAMQGELPASVGSADTLVGSPGGGTRQRWLGKLIAAGLIFMAGIVVGLNLRTL
jgi:hypothetical protein